MGGVIPSPTMDRLGATAPERQKQVCGGSAGAICEAAPQGSDARAGRRAWRSHAGFADWPFSGQLG